MPMLRLASGAQRTYTDQGPRNGRPIILLTSQTEQGNEWSAEISKLLLGRGYRVLQFGPTGPRQHLPIDSFRSEQPDVEVLIETLQLAPAHIVEKVGDISSACQVVADRRPNLVASVALILSTDSAERLTSSGSDGSTHLARPITAPAVILAGGEDSADIDVTGYRALLQNLRVRVFPDTGVGFPQSSAAMLVDEISMNVGRATSNAWFAARSVRMSLVPRLVSGAMRRILSTRVPGPTRSFIVSAKGEPDVVQVPTRHGLVRCFIYRAKGDNVGPVPVVVHLHGGGFILNNARVEDFIALELAQSAGATVVSVDYSTAPSVRYPVAEEQAYDVLQWVAAHSADQGWDSDRIGLSGQSAGAKLALSALALARLEGPAVYACALIVPPVDMTIPAKEYISLLARPLINPKTVRLIQRTYFVDETRRFEPTASPLLDPNLAANMPPVLIVSAELDTITAQTRRFASRLRYEGVEVTHHVAQQVDHGYLGIDTSPPEEVRRSLHLLAEHFRVNRHGNGKGDTSDPPQAGTLPLAGPLSP
ncbi:alpha/beta fold hydrolase [Clavibacter michiganensis subsp. michiganensis]|uniref:alpha/beta fold hydrolase n=1 Tax=Clavibacter michiganensis TaxID=28447 RepID=UPI000A36016E|nr:alpha/beta fold hydrolase [Clavibacter michiganensis]MDO4099304.1 alpha/beta fold hydrolase [Clavibacter michiganensis]OUE26510.1 Acetyl esterase [Clavibacter michiganensis subsp. michiganensis]QXP04640.1 alpha/beta fold hydrolase [Clavibacter michiganensis subsp. michiganensis]